LIAALTRKRRGPLELVAAPSTVDTWKEVARVLRSALGHDISVRTAQRYAATAPDPLPIMREQRSGRVIANVPELVDWAERQRVA
jgi:hypothetical protein